MGQAEVSELLKDLLPLLNQFVLPFVESLSPNRNGMPLSTSPAWCLGSNARLPRGSRTCTIKNGREVYWICAVGP